MRCLVYVVGASSGIGRATAALFSRRGANVMLTGRNEANLQETCDTCQSPAHMVTGDMTNESDVENIINETISKLGRLDILVSCLLFLSSILLLSPWWLLLSIDSDILQLSDVDYKPLRPKDIRLPPPAPPSDRLLQAVDLFYQPPSNDCPVDE